MIDLICTLPLAASLLASCAPPPPFATGYVEGEFTLVAPVAVAQIDAVNVNRGDRVEAGEVRTALDDGDPAPREGMPLGNKP